MRVSDIFSRGGVGDCGGGDHDYGHRHGDNDWHESSYRRHNGYGRNNYHYGHHREHEHGLLDLDIDL